MLLGNAMETNLRRALTISDGDWSILWGSPMAIAIWTLAIVGLLLPPLIGRVLRLRTRNLAGGAAGKH